jgi:putative endonuclease
MAGYWLYILYSNYPKTYVGISNDPQRRIIEHNDKRSSFTSKYGPWEFLLLEEHLDRIAARLAEKKYKSGSGRRKIAKLLEQRNIAKNSG